MFDFKNACCRLRMLLTQTDAQKRAWIERWRAKGDIEIVDQVRAELNRMREAGELSGRTRKR